jgi:competence protein ComEC
MVLGGLSLITGSLFEPLGQVVAAVTLPFAIYTVRAAELFASFPGSALPVGPVSLGWVAGFYGILFGLTLFGGRIKANLRRESGGMRPATGAVLGAALLVVGIGAALAWRAYFAAPDGRLHLTVLNVGSGDALLIQTPAGRYLLIDGGPSASQLSDALGRRLPMGGELDFLIVAASGDEHVGALPSIVERHPPTQVLWAGPLQGSRSAQRVQEALVELGLEPLPAEPGQSLDLGDGAHLEVLAVSKRGAVLLLEWSKFRALMPVGLDFDTLEDLKNDTRLPDITALLLADSGYAPTNPPEWIDKLHPQVVLLSVAAGDRDGRPDAETLEAVEGYTLLRTDRKGWIEIATAWERLRV